MREECNDKVSVLASFAPGPRGGLRGRPGGVTNRLNNYAICIAASYEAKRLGISLGTRNGEAKVIAPNFVMCESDAAKYQYVNKQMQAIFASYSPSFTMKSVDEG